MADEELRELADINLSHQYGGGRWGSGGGGGGVWGRSPGGGGPPPGGGSLSHHRAPPPQHHNTRAAEAEDIMGRGGGPGGGRGRSGLYYSPPGTSYTIVERPAPKHPRGTYLGSSSTFTNNSRTPASSKKRPISPEQVLKLFGHNNNMKTPEIHPGSRRPSPIPHMEQLTVRTVNMSRGQQPDSHGFGICVKGGSKDAGVGVYISRVEEGSVAERAGLRPGDSILEVNGTPFTGISHEEALKMLKSCKQLSMTVRSPNLPTPSQPPPPPPSSSGPWLLRQTYSWMDRQGRPVSPPLEYARASPPVLVAPPPPPPRWTYSRSNKEKAIRKVELSIEPGQSLGLMIRGGIEYNLGIFITGVDKDSVADRAGLMIGDQILEVNGQSFLDVTHDEAVNQLKFHKRMTLTVRDVGKVPHSCTAYDPAADPWDTPKGRRLHASRSAALQMVDEKARVVLKKSEFSTLTYYLDEYSARQMTIEAFVAVLLELLNTPDKYTLLTELREVVMPEDKVRFDELVYRREAEGQRLQHMMDSRHSTQHTRRKPMPTSCCDNNSHAMLMANLHDIPGPPEYHASSARPCKFPVGGGDRERETVMFNEPEEFRTPSEDSGLGLGPPELGNGRRSHLEVGLWDDCDLCSGRVPTDGSAPRWSPSTCLQKRTSDLALSNDEDYDQGHQDYGETDADAEMDSRRRHSSLAGSVAALNQQPYDEANMQLAHKLGRGFDMKEEQELLEADAGSGSMRRHGSNMRLSRGDLADSSADNEAQVVADQQGNLRITVKKTKPLLGIAIEGGANTRHPLPRIINIHENGAAFDAGGLEVGQLILEVDGHKVEGMQHQEVARLIAESFARREKHEIEFLVVEAKKSNLEPKPTALIFLEA